MTEAQWMASDDPAAMLQWVTDRPRSSGTGVRTSPPIPGDRKLRLFACACWRRVGAAVESTARNHPEVADCGEQWADSGRRPVGRPHFGYPLEEDAGAAARGMAASVAYVEAADVAALVREVFGNPFRSVTLFRTDGNSVCRNCGCIFFRVGFVEECLDCGGGDFRPYREGEEWLTPQVLSLVQAAYDERPGRECKCTTLLDGKAAYAKCPYCGGTGRINDGALDPLRLAILADALEEAGCEDEGVLKHLRGFEERTDLPSLYGEKYWRHLPGPHVRGCWALDLILGR